MVAGGGQDSHGTCLDGLRCQPHVHGLGLVERKHEDSLRAELMKSNPGKKRSWNRLQESRLHTHHLLRGKPGSAVRRSRDDTQVHADNALGYKHTKRDGT